MNQASIFFRVFDLAFFAPGLVMLLPVWLMTQAPTATDKLDLVSGAMTAGAWVLLSYAMGLFVHGVSRLAQPAVDRLMQRRRWAAVAGGIAAAAMVLIVYGPDSTLLKAGEAALALTASLYLGHAVGHWQNPVAPKSKASTSVDASPSMVTLFDRAKQQELGLYFWYMRATSTNIAYAVPMAFAIWVALGRGRPLKQTQPLLDPTNETVLLCGLLVGAVATFVLAASGRDYHRAWKAAREALTVSHARADDLAEKTATKP